MDDDRWCHGNSAVRLLSQKMAPKKHFVTCRLFHVRSYLLLSDRILVLI